MRTKKNQPLIMFIFNGNVYIYQVHWRTWLPAAENVLVPCKCQWSRIQYIPPTNPQYISTLQLSLPQASIEHIIIKKILHQDA